jgi:hypothetical protein
VSFARSGVAATVGRSNTDPIFTIGSLLIVSLNLVLIFAGGVELLALGQITICGRNEIIEGGANFAGNFIAGLPIGCSHVHLFKSPGHRVNKGVDSILFS